MNKKPNFIHQENHAGKAFTGNAVWMAYYWVNRTLNKYEKYWCIKRIKRKKHRNKCRYKLKYKKITMATIKWYKVKCSFYKQTIGFKIWQDIIDFMSTNIGFDYIIEGQYSEPFSGVDAYYDTKTKTFEKL